MVPGWLVRNRRRAKVICCGTRSAASPRPRGRYPVEISDGIEVVSDDDLTPRQRHARELALALGQIQFTL
jgi:hypothetical protein